MLLQLRKQVFAAEVAGAKHFIENVDYKNQESNEVNVPAPSIEGSYLTSL